MATHAKQNLKNSLQKLHELQYTCIVFDPVFSITNNLLTYITRIEAAKAIIDHSPLIPAWEARFRSEALNRTVHYGTKIEGNELTEEQSDQLLKLQFVNDSKEALRQTGITARERDVQEVINYRNVLTWTDRQTQVSTTQVFSLDTLNTLHRLTVQGLIDNEGVGQFRKKQVIVQSATSGGVIFRPPVAVEVPYLIDDFFVWGKSQAAQQVHAVLRAAITHYQIVYIHPFIEGNGRTARAMATLLLYSLGYDFKRFFSLEQYFDSDVEAYYNALLSVQQSGKQDLTYWLEYFCYGVALEIDKIQRQVERLSKDLRMKKQLGKQVALSERQIILLELFQQQDQISSYDAQNVLPNVSVDTILRDLKDLIEKGVIEKEGVTKGVTYRLRE